MLILILKRDLISGLKEDRNVNRYRQTSAVWNKVRFLSMIAQKGGNNIFVRFYNRRRTHRMLIS